MAGAKFDETVRAMELLLSRRQIERIMARTYTGSSRVQVLRNAVNLGLDQIEEDHRRNNAWREPLAAARRARWAMAYAMKVPDGRRR